MVAAFFYDRKEVAAFSFFLFFCRCSLPASCFFYKSVDDAYVSRITRLTLLAPDIIHGILTGTLGKSLGIEMCKKPFPVLWDEQKKFFGLDEEAR